MCPVNLFLECFVFVLQFEKNRNRREKNRKNIMKMLHLNNVEKFPMLPSRLSAQNLNISNTKPTKNAATENL